MSNVVPLHAGADTRSAHIERLVEAIDLPIGRWDAGYRLIYCNPPYVTWANRPRDQLLGRTLAGLYGDVAWAAARDAFIGAFAGRTLSYERLLTHLGGPPRWARIQVFPDREPDGRVDAVYSIAYDIHDYVTVRDALQAAQRRLYRFTENIPYPLTYVDRDFVLRFVNRAYVEAAGQSAEQMVGRHIGDVRGAARWAEHRPYFERALAGEVCEYTRLARLANAGPRWMRTTYTPDIDEQGNVVGIYTSTIDVHDLTVAQQQLKRSAERDALTDVLTRRAMMEQIDAAVVRAATAPVALFFLDLDGFKPINDDLGHRAGDDVLINVARSLSAAVRADDAVGRFGGDEFLVLARVNDAAAAAVLADHLLAAVRASCADGAIGRAISASIGYALAPVDAANAFELVRRADDAMYAAKRRGRDCAVHARMIG